MGVTLCPLVQHGTSTQWTQVSNPGTRHKGLAEQIFENRQQVYEAAKAKHPDRWSGDTRNWSLDGQVWLNPEKASVIQVEEKQIY